MNKQENTYEVNIDFDEASKAWRQNKEYKGYGYFTYTTKCKQLTKTGKQCRRLCSPNSDYCYQHQC
jgi:hypothetical protein